MPKSNHHKKRLRHLKKKNSAPQKSFKTYKKTADSLGQYLEDNGIEACDDAGLTFFDSISYKTNKNGELEKVSPKTLQSKFCHIKSFYPEAHNWTQCKRYIKNWRKNDYKPNKRPCISKHQLGLMAKLVRASKRFFILLLILFVGLYGAFLSRVYFLRKISYVFSRIQKFNRMVV